MNRVKLSMNLLAINGSQVLTLKGQNGKPVYFVGVPASELFIPRDATGAAYLMATMYETPSSQFSDFAIKPYVSAAQYNAMSDEQRRAIPFIGKGSYVAEQPSTAMTSNAVSADATATLPPTQTEGFDPNDPLGSSGFGQ